jgi:hypothetical protein
LDGREVVSVHVGGLGTKLGKFGDPGECELGARIGKRQGGSFLDLFVWGLSKSCSKFRRTVYGAGKSHGGVKELGDLVEGVPTSKGNGMGLCGGTLESTEDRLLIIQIDASVPIFIMRVVKCGKGQRDVGCTTFL